MAEEEVVRFNVKMEGTIEISKLEWEAYRETNEDELDALWELGNAVEGSEFPVPDGRVWITDVDEVTKLEGG